MEDPNIEPHPLAAFTAKLVEKYGAPQVLDVEHSIQVYKPTLSGSSSPASFYILPPPGMSADALVEWFESAPGFRGFHLTLVPILGLDTYHKPLLSSDEFAKKYFQDSHLRIVRVVGKTDQAMEAMTAFVEALKLPFDASLFPHHGDFSVSAYHPPEDGRATELKLLFKPADHTLLMKVERLVIVHLAERNLGREIAVSRHFTRNQPPELILTSTRNAPAGLAYLESLATSLPHATQGEITEATELAQRTGERSGAEASGTQARFYHPQVPSRTFSSTELRKMAIASLADIMRGSRFANAAEIKVVQGGTAVEISFPRTISSLWLATSFSEGKHIKQVASSCVGVRTDPSLREGWAAHFMYDSRAGKLQIRAVEAGSEPPSGWRLVPG